MPHWHASFFILFEMKTIKLTSFLLVLSALFFCGCNTTEGFGEDVEDAGDAISDQARDAS